MKLCIVGLLYLAATTDALFGNGNNARRRRRLSDSGARSVDVDAATGTVLPSDSEKAAANTATSCDGQMAESLVIANQAMIKAASERDEAKSQAQAYETKISELEDAVKDLQATVQESNSDKRLEEKEALIVGLQEQLKMGQAGLEVEFGRKVKEIEADRDAKVAALSAELEANDKEHQVLLETTKEEAKNYLVSEVNAIKGELEETRAKAEKEMQKLVESHREEIKDLSAAHEEALAEMDGLVRKLRKETATLKEQVKEAEQKIAESIEEVEHWRGNFANRSYCNVTDISSDLYTASAVALAKTANITSLAASTAAATASKVAGSAATTASQAASTAAVHGKKYLAGAQVKAGEGYNLSRSVYNTQYEKHWPKVKPHYDRHISPLVEKFYEWKVAEFDPRWKVVQERWNDFKLNVFDPAYAAAKKEYNKQFEKLVEVYGKQCQAALKVAQDFASKHDYPFEGTLEPYIRYSCENSELSVTYALRGVLILVLLPFVRPTLRLFFRILSFIWCVFVALTPLRFFISRKKKNPETTSDKATAKGAPQKKASRLSQ